MNILQVLPRLNVGGVETGTVDLAKYLVGQGHRCVVVSAGGELVQELEAHGIKHYQLPVHSKFFPVMVKASRALAEIIRREDIQIVHARSRVPAWVGFMACRQTRATFLTTAHGHYSRHIFSTMMGWGKYTIVPSTVIGKHMMENFGVPLENIRLIPRSVDLKRYIFQLPKGQAKTQFTVGVIGRITPIKGQIYFLKALARVLRSMPYVNAWIVGGVSPGKDHYKEELEVWTRRLGLTHAVKFLGNRRDIPQILRQLDCLVMPSIAEEAFGRVIVEAQASGVPVIATKVGGVSEIIDDGQDGLLVFPKDHEVLAEAILKILKDPPLARQLAQAGRRKVEEKFSLTKMAEDTVAVYSEALAQPRILVIKISAVGDAVLAIPSFAAIKKKFPSAHVACLVGREAKDVFQRCPYIDELVVCDFQNKDRGLRGIFRLAKKLLRRRFDLVIDLQNNRKSHLLGYLTCSSERYGYDNGKFSFLLNHRIKDTKEPISPVEHQFQVLKMLGIMEEPQALELWPSAEDERFASDFLKEYWLGKERLIGINIGASPRWNTKRWRAKRFAKLCDALAKKDYRILVTGSSSDAAFAKEILDQTKTKPVCAVAQTTLLQLASLVRHCDCFVTGDSAPLHIAAAMKTPVVAFFGPTDPRRHMPKGVRGLVLRKDCVPCYSGVCPKKTNACMESITAEDVLKAIEELLVNHKDSA
ncbi:MAG: lipopolysaccharide heptosyltransferase II [Candidatus Omnitrophota bacterium]